MVWKRWLYPGLQHAFIANNGTTSDTELEQQSSKRSSKLQKQILQVCVSDLKSVGDVIMILIIISNTLHTYRVTFSATQRKKVNSILRDFSSLC